jgi:hypothetical protein
VVDGGVLRDSPLGFADSVGERGRNTCSSLRALRDHAPTARDESGVGASRSIFPLGLADEVNDIAPPADDGVINPGARLASAVPTITIDEAVLRTKVPRIDFIKMDIEGSELSALRGAETSIRRWCPKLAISLYHRPEDFFSIPSWIDSLGVGYRLFLDHYSIHHEETVLYAMV